MPSQVPHPKIPPKVSPQVPSSVFLLQCQLWGWGLLQLWGWWLLWPQLWGWWLLPEPPQAPQVPSPETQEL